jgi:hypothetical protein
MQSLSYVINYSTEQSSTACYIRVCIWNIACVRRYILSKIISMGEIFFDFVLLSFTDRIWGSVNI